MTQNTVTICGLHDFVRLLEECIRYYTKVTAQDGCLVRIWALVAFQELFELLYRDASVGCSLFSRNLFDMRKQVGQEPSRGSLDRIIWAVRKIQAESISKLIEVRNILD